VLQGRHIDVTIPYLNIDVRFGWGDRFDHFPINSPTHNEPHTVVSSMEFYRVTGASMHRGSALNTLNKLRRRVRSKSRRYDMFHPSRNRHNRISAWTDSTTFVSAFAMNVIINTSECGFWRYTTSQLQNVVIAPTSALLRQSVKIHTVHR